MLWAQLHDSSENGAARRGAARSDLSSQNLAAGDDHLGALVALLRRRSRMIIMTALLGAALAWLVGVAIGPRYTARAQIAVDLPPTSAPTQSADARPDDRLVDTHITMLQSASHMRRVLESLSDAAAAIAISKTTDTNGGWRIIGSWASALATSMASPRTLESLERNVRFDQERRSRIISISFTSPDPNDAAMVANRIAELYVASQGQQKRASMEREIESVDNRIEQARLGAEATRAAAQRLMHDRATPVVDGADAQKDAQRLRDALQEAKAADLLQDRLSLRQSELKDQLQAFNPDVVVVEKATSPQRRSSPNPILFMLPAFILCAIGAGMAAVALERLDEGLWSEGDVDERLGIACAGLVPLLPKKSPGRYDQYLPDQPGAPYSESIRSILAALSLAPQDGPRVILTTSSVPGEGATTLARSLATGAARLGRRVLLIDLDLRCRWAPAARPKDKSDSAERGAPLWSPIKLATQAGFDYLVMPKTADDPIGLIAGEQFSLMIRQSREHYDFIFIDSAPLLSAAETRLLAPYSDIILLVVRWRGTSWRIAQNALHVIRSAGGAMRGDDPVAVLVQVDPKLHARRGTRDALEARVRNDCYRTRTGDKQARRQADPPAARINSDRAG